MKLTLNLGFNKKQYKNIFNLDNPNNNCSICNGLSNQLFNTYKYDDKICIKTCYLCHMVLNYDKNFTGNLYLIELTEPYDIDQIAINKKVNEIIYSQYKILHIKDYGWDFNYKIVDKSIYKMLLNNENMNKYLVFYTNMVLYNLEKTNTIFDDFDDESNQKNKFKYNKYDVTFFK